jgi:hypothetical protein
MTPKLPHPRRHSRPKRAPNVARIAIVHSHDDIDSRRALAQIIAQAAIRRGVKLVRAPVPA